MSILNSLTLILIFNEIRDNHNNEINIKIARLLSNPNNFSVFILDNNS